MEAVKEINVMEHVVETPEEGKVSYLSSPKTRTDKDRKRTKLQKESRKRNR